MSYFKQGEPRTNFSFWETHHFFTGYLAFIIFGFLSFYSIFYWPRGLVYVFMIGALISLWVIVDDWLQHFIQREELDKYGKWETRSFWHWFPYWLLKKIKDMRKQ